MIVTRQIRSRIRQVQANAENLKKILAADQAKKVVIGMTPYLCLEVKSRSRRNTEAPGNGNIFIIVIHVQVELIFSHIQEVQELHDASSASRSPAGGIRSVPMLAPSSGKSSAGMSDAGHRDPLDTQLPPIEVQQGLGTSHLTAFVNF